jgi:hypothetical protein
VVSCFRNYFNARGYDVDERGLFKLIWRKIFNDGEALADEASHLVKKDKEEKRNG